VVNASGALCTQELEDERGKARAIPRKCRSSRVGEKVIDAMPTNSAMARVWFVELGFGFFSMR
jgi:hypothetical protein